MPSNNQRLLKECLSRRAVLQCKICSESSLFCVPCWTVLHVKPKK